MDQCQVTDSDYFHVEKSRFASPDPSDNLLHGNLLSLFRNIKYVKIDTTRWLKFNLLSFLSIINDNSRDIYYEITGYSLSSFQYDDQEFDITFEYNDHGWNIRYHKLSILISSNK